MSFPKKVAVIGANGFVGSRVVELFHLGGECEVVPVVRGVSGLPRLSRFELDWRLADARNEAALAKALAGCEAVVHSVVGDGRVIEAAAAALIPAAAAAGVRRVVYLSTASVHGQNPPAGTSEESVLSDRQDVSYNNAKVRAERILFRDAKAASLELFALRPSVVFGPRDRWITTLAAELENNVAWLIEGGRGICNSIYVDNLVHAVRLALGAGASAAGQAYLVGDAETITWAELYGKTCDGLGLSRDRIHDVAVPSFPARGWGDRLDGVRSSPLAQRLIAHVPRKLKTVAKGAIKGLKPEVMPTSWVLPSRPGPSPTQEMVRLQQCSYRLPQTKAQRELNYQPPVTLAEGLDRTLAWLRWTKS